MVFFLALHLLRSITHHILPTTPLLLSLHSLARHLPGAIERESKPDGPRAWTPGRGPEPPDPTTPPGPTGLTGTTVKFGDSRSAGQVARGPPPGSRSGARRAGPAP
eukprot:172510-Hanusia_phi.AAC.1